MSEELSDLAKSLLDCTNLTDREKELIEGIPELVNSLAEQFQKIMDECKKWEIVDPEPIDFYIQHVGYTHEQLGYEK